MSDTRLWTFVADMNSSGSISISDILLWFKWLYFYPGDYIFFAMMEVFPNVGNFFEISCDSYGGLASGIISFVVWVVTIEGLGAPLKK